MNSGCTIPIYIKLCCWTSFLFRKHLYDVQVSGCTQNGNSRMFLQPAPAVFYLDISYICTLLTFAAVPPYPWFSVYFCSISSETFPTLHAKYPSVQKVCSFPKMFPQIIRVLFPNMICCIALHPIYHLTDRHCWFCFYHVMDMVFVSFHMSDNYMMFLTYLIRELFYVI